MNISADTNLSLNQAYQQVLGLLQNDHNQQAQELLIQLLQSHPEDGPLVFLHASLLAQQQHFDQALTEYIRAINCAPDLHIARFQLCLLAISTENSTLVEQHLPPLCELNDDQYLNRFANALVAIFEQKLEQASTLIEQGIELNQQNPSLNTDMQQLLSRINKINEPKQETQATSNNTINSSVLLDIYNNNH